MKDAIKNIDWNKPVIEKSLALEKTIYDLSMKKFEETKNLIIENLNDLDPKKMSNVERRILINRMEVFFKSIVL